MKMALFILMKGIVLDVKAVIKPALMILMNLIKKF
jgi:hypothetical protein